MKERERTPVRVDERRQSMDISPKTITLVLCAATNLSIFPPIKLPMPSLTPMLGKVGFVCPYLRIYIQYTDFILAMILTTFIFWTYREINKLRATLYQCESFVH